MAKVARGLPPLLVCVAIVMLGVGITASVLPFFAERLALLEGTPPSRLGMHVTALTAIFALTQLCFAPIWGTLSDRIGRRPMLIIGICGFGLSQAVFGIVTTMPLLYAVRAAGGLLSAALLPSAAAYVADLTAEPARDRGMAWLNLAAGVGTMAGPALGGLLARRAWHFEVGTGYLHVDAFSVPFFAAAVVSLLALSLALRWLPPAVIPGLQVRSARRDAFMGQGVMVLLGSGFALQAGIMLFEATFTLFGQRRLGYGPAETGMVFMVCSLVMLPIQFVGIALARRIGEFRQMAAGFGLMGVGFLMFLGAATISAIALAIVFLGAGMAFVLPVSPSLISKRSAHGAGRALGALSAAQSAGQVAGSIVGGALLGLGDRVPYLAAGAFMLVVAVAFGVGFTGTGSATRT